MTAPSFKRIKGADYTGMHPSKWPEPLPQFKAAFDHGIAVIEAAKWMSRSEKASYQRTLHQTLGTAIA
jgi:hypothetical protein